MKVGILLLLAAGDLVDSEESCTRNDDGTAISAGVTEHAIHEDDRAE